MTNNLPAAAEQRKMMLDTVEKCANVFLSRMVRGHRLEVAAGRIINTMHVLMQNNAKIAACTRASVGQCVAMSALTGLMPGGNLPDVYLIPREISIKVPGAGPNGRDLWKKELRLNWQISYRGYQTLAKRDGWNVVPVVVSNSDELVYLDSPEDPRWDKAIVLRGGERLWLKRDLDNPAIEWTEVRGVLIRATEDKTGNEAAEWYALKFIEKRVRSSETFKSALEKLARQAEGIPDSDWKRKPSPATVAKVTAETDIQAILASVKGPWGDWVVEMVAKTAIIAAVKNSLVPLSDATEWALTADTAAGEGNSPLRDEGHETSSKTAGPSQEDIIDVPMNEGGGDEGDEGGSGMDEVAPDTKH